MTNETINPTPPEPLHPTDIEQTTHSMERRADGKPLEQIPQRPDLIQVPDEDVPLLPENQVKR